MNKKLICLFMFVFTLGLGFTACGDDDDDVVDYAAEIAGTYRGNLSVKIGEDAPVVAEQQDIKLKRIGENKVELALENFHFENLNVGTITISDIAVSEKNGTVNLADKSVNVPLAEGTMTADVSVTSSSVKDKQMKLNIGVTNVKAAGVAMPLGDMVITFTGDKK